MFIQKTTLDDRAMPEEVKFAIDERGVWHVTSPYFQKALVEKKPFASGASVYAHYVRAHSGQVHYVLTYMKYSKGDNRFRRELNSAPEYIRARYKIFEVFYNGEIRPYVLLRNLGTPADNFLTLDIQARVNPLSIMLLIIFGIIDELITLHGAGCIHGDLKPANILVQWDPTNPTSLRVSIIDVNNIRKINEKIVRYCCKFGGTLGYSPKELKAEEEKSPTPFNNHAHMAEESVCHLRMDNDAVPEERWAKLSYRQTLIANTLYFLHASKVLWVIFAYIEPEEAQDWTPRASADIYSFGYTLKMLTDLVSQKTELIDQTTEFVSQTTELYALAAHMLKMNEELRPTLLEVKDRVEKISFLHVKKPLKETSKAMSGAFSFSAEDFEDEGASADPSAPTSLFSSSLTIFKQSSWDAIPPTMSQEVQQDDEDMYPSMPPLVSISPPTVARGSVETVKAMSSY